MVEEKLHKVQYSKETRKNNKGAGFDWDRFGRLLTLSCFCVLMGLFVGSFSDYNFAVSDVGEAEKYYIDRYTFTFLPGDHPKMQGATAGFTATNGDGEIFLKRGLSLEQVEDFCNHELMHDMGIGSEYHDFVYNNQDRVETEVCSRLREAVVKDRNKVW